MGKIGRPKTRYDLLKPTIKGLVQKGESAQKIQRTLHIRRQTCQRIVKEIKEGMK